jgi:hypothetical protein
MIFAPCEGGISHNEIENAKPEDLTAGCNVLLQAVLARAGQGGVLLNLQHLRSATSRRKCPLAAIILPILDR